MLEERVIRCRSAKRFEERYLRKGFDEQISVIRILDAGLQPAAVLKPDRDNDTSVIRGPAIRKAGWLNSNGAVKHTAACEKSYISGVIRKSTEKPYFQKALPGAVSA